MSTTESTLMTPPEVAARLRCSYWTVLRLIHAGKIRAKRVGGLIRVESEWLESYIETAKKTQPAGR